MKIPPIRLLTAMIAMIVSLPSSAADTYLTGNITNLTSTGGGLLIMLDSGIPVNCTGTPYNWLLIRAENKAMIALTLTMYSLGKKNATVYTNPVTPGSFCEINQYDPSE